MNEMIDATPNTYNGETIIGKDDITNAPLGQKQQVLMRYAKQQSQMVNDATLDSRAKIAQELGFAGNMSSETLDYLTQGLINDFYAEKAFNRELNADSSKYQRAMKDMVAAGLNPAQVLGSLSGSNPGYSPASVSGGYYSQAAIKNKDIASKGLAGLLAGIAMIGAAMVKMLA